MATDLILEDTTLRDGEQTPGIAFSEETKIAIHDALVDAGVRWIEVGIPAMGGDELRTLRRLVDRGSKAKLVAWNRGRREDVEQSLSLGFTAIHVGLPTSELHLSHSVGRDRSWLICAACDLIRLAKDAGAFVSISAEDVGRSDLNFVVDYAGAVFEAGADRLRLSDTVGVLLPTEYAEIIRRIRHAVPIDLQCHTHNDYGLGVANTLAGVEAGARYFHVTVNGIGERAGMPDLATVGLLLQNRLGIDLGLDCSRLTDLSRLVADACRTSVQPWQPVVGPNVFMHESGIHAKGMLSDARTFEPFMPELVGGTRRFVAGKHSGRALIRHLLTEASAEIVEDLLEPCLVTVRMIASRRGTALSSMELLSVYEGLLSARES
jgi:isopropylmalate/homocitrate/citramalate synthase